MLFCVLLMISISALAVAEYAGQEKEEISLGPKYKAFLAEAGMILTSEEKEVFQGLKTDQQRDRFIRQFWISRGGRQRGVRNNINMLRLVRMVQALNLTEDQVASIMPAMNKNETEKQALQRDLQLHMRDLRLLLGRETPQDQKLEELLRSIKTLKDSLQVKEVEFEKFLEDNLTLIQQANYIIFSQDFYRGLQEQLNNARRTQQHLQQKIKRKI